LDVIGPEAIIDASVFSPPTALLFQSNSATEARIEWGPEACKDKPNCMSLQNLRRLVRFVAAQAGRKPRSSYCFFAIPEGGITTNKPYNFCVKGRWKEDK
jgi:hypothetical protein